MLSSGNESLRAIIFDCDGVLFDSEPIHYAAFKRVLGSDGVKLTEQSYRQRYLALDVKNAITTFYQDINQRLWPARLADLLDKRAGIFKDLVCRQKSLIYPAVPELVMALSLHYPLAIASGAHRQEVQELLASANLQHYFDAIIVADDVQNGKPHPEIYLKALEALNNLGNKSSPIAPAQCLVIEDAKAGIAAAHAAGMKVVAVATSYPADELVTADLVTPAIAALDLSQINRLFGPDVNA